MSMSLFVLLVTIHANNALSPDDIAAALAGQAEAIESFSAEYTFGIHRPSKEDVYIEEHVFRMSGPMKYFSRTKVRENGELHSETYAFDGNLNYSMLTGVNGGPGSGQIGVPEWRKPLYYLSPVDLLGWHKGESLGVQLNRARLSYNEETRTLVAIEDDTAHRTDIHLDDKMRIRRIVRGYAVSSEVQARYAEQYGSDPPHTFRTRSSVEIDEYLTVNGMDIPVRGRKVFYDQDEELLARLSKQVEERLLDPTELAMRTAYDVPYDAFKEFSVTVDASSLEINPQLARSDFQLKFPAGTLMFDYILDRGFVAGEELEKLLASLVDEIQGATLISVEEDSKTVSGSDVAGALKVVTSPNSRLAREWKKIGVLLVLCLACAVFVSRKGIQQERRGERD